MIRNIEPAALPWCEITLIFQQIQGMGHGDDADPELFCKGALARKAGTERIDTGKNVTADFFINLTSTSLSFSSMIAFITSYKSQSIKGNTA